MSFLLISSGGSGELTSKEMTYSWNLYSAAVADFIYVWNILGSVAANFVYKWKIHLYLNKFFTYKWKIYQYALRGFTYAWRIGVGFGSKVRYEFTAEGKIVTFFRRNRLG